MPFFEEIKKLILLVKSAAVTYTFNKGINPLKKSLFKRRFLTGFTFIELLISLAVMGIAFLPLMQMFTTGLDQVYSIGELNTASFLAREEMEKIKNLNFTKEQLKTIGNKWNPSLERSALDLNNGRWRVLRKLDEYSDPLEVRVLVYTEPVTESSRPVVELVTLIEDWEGVVE